MRCALLYNIICNDLTMARRPSVASTVLKPTTRRAILANTSRRCERRAANGRLHDARKGLHAGERGSERDRRRHGQSRWRVLTPPFDRASAPPAASPAPVPNDYDIIYLSVLLVAYQRVYTYYAYTVIVSKAEDVCTVALGKTLNIQAHFKTLNYSPIIIL